MENLEVWQYAGDCEPHDDMERTIKIVKAAYGWTLDDDGRLCGLVAGDMGWASTGYPENDPNMNLWYDQRLSLISKEDKKP